MGSKRQKMDSQTSSNAECLVCCQVPRAKIIQCNNGHSICDDCSEKVTVCPTCRSSGVWIRNLLAERLLDSFEFKCSWSERGCEKTTALSAHEDHCEKNPDIIKFCSIAKRGGKCDYKFTPKWLNNPENCAEFLNHVKTCLGYRCHNGIVQCGRQEDVWLGFRNLLSKKLNAAKPAHHYMAFLYPLNLGDDAKVELHFLIILLKVDPLGNKFVFFVIVRLTPETTPPLLVKFTISGRPSSAMASQWGANSLPSQSWTQKTICFQQFSKLLETISNVIQPEIPLPFSLPLSFLSEYYIGQDKVLKVNFTLERDS